MSSAMRKLGFEELKSARPSPEELSGLERFPVAALLENIRSLYNVGSMFRTADGALLRKLYLCGYTGYPPRKEIDKTSLGSVGSVPWEYDADPCAVARRLKAEGYRLCAVEHTDGSVPYDRASFSFPLCFVVGNEVEGISGELISLCDSAIEIPMHGVKQSLNVAVAFGVVAYHITGIWKRTRGTGTV